MEMDRIRHFECITMEVQRRDSSDTEMCVMCASI